MAKTSIDYTLTLTENSIQLDTIQSPEGTNYLKISGNRFWTVGEPGEPEIPYTVIRFLVPDGAYDFSAQIMSTENIRTLYPGLKLCPVQKDVPINDYTPDLFTEPDENLYETFSSGFSADVLEDSRLEGKYHVVTVKVKPVSYNGATNTLKLCKNMNIKLAFNESQMLKQVSSNAELPGFINIADIVVNPPARKGDMEKSAGPPYQSVPPSRYYIISERSLLPALQDLATWKRQKGYTVVLKAIEDIYEDSRYEVNPESGIVDEAASLRKYLQDEFTIYGTTFCLLIGDHKTRMPIRKVKSSSSVLSDPHGKDYIPTDNYFSDLSGNKWETTWDDNGLYVCLLNKFSFSPDIYVGRLLCHTKEEIANYTSKLILYESNPGRGNGDYLNYAALTVQDDGKYSYKKVLDKMNETFNSVDCLLDCAISNPSTYGSPTGKDVIDKMNSVGYCSWSGHGEPGTVACSGLHDDTEKWEYIKALESYHLNKDNPALGQTNLPRNCIGSGLDMLTNFDSPSVVYTLSCTTCPFDIYNGWRISFDLPHTLASSYTVGGKYGGVAYLGNTREGYFGPSSNQETYFLDNLKSYPKIGVAEAMSKYQYLGNNHVRTTHNLIGDPEFEMWLSKPSVQDATLKWRDNCISLNCYGAVGGSLIVFDGQGGISAYNIKESSLVNIPYPSDSDKMVSVGLFKTGFLPIVNLDCYGQHLTNCNKNFVIREASLGTNEENDSNVIIGENAYLRLHSVDFSKCGKSLTVDDGGILEINSDKDVIIEGSSVMAGGNMTVKAERVQISNGFAVKFGGTFSINK